MTTPLLATAPAGAVARARLAARSATALHWLGAAACGAGAAEVAAADDALLALRTELRSLRPLLDRDWTVGLRTGLDRVAAVVQEVRHDDERLRLLHECGADAGEPVPAGVADHRAERALALRTALGPATRARLALLASGGSPAPLRTPEPPGDAHLPAAFVLPPMLRRRWRKLVRETSPGELADVLRRAAELEVAVELAAHGGIRVPELAVAAAALGAAAAAARRAEDAGALHRRLADGPVRDAVAAVAAGRDECLREVVNSVAALARLGHLVVAADGTPARIAAGGLVVRAGAGQPEVLLVHRVRHGDWSVPKGAALPGEPTAACALREVAEETGLRCRLVEELHGVTYRDRNGRAKHVRYWLMTPVARIPAAVDPTEVDEVRWVPLADAEALVARRRDRAVLEAFRRRGVLDDDPDRSDDRLVA
jgi:8-oxo-dGTP pyrophosphatase MutT (NUDIX family)